MLNIAAIMGRLTRDPELRTTPSGVSVTTFSLAVDRSYCKPGEERQTDFIDVVAWRGTAEFACKYFTKGQMMAVTGSIQTRSYEDKQGNKRKAVEIVASEVNFCGSKAENGRQSNEPDMYAPPPSRAYSSNSGSARQPTPPPSEDFEEILSDDDLPF